MVTVPRLQRYYQGAKTTCLPSLRLIDSPAGTSSSLPVRVSLARSRWLQTSHRAGGLQTGAPYGRYHSRRRKQVLPGFLAVHPVALRRSRDPGQPDCPLPCRDCQYCPQNYNTEGANDYDIEAQSRRFTTRCVRFTTPVTERHATTRSRLVGYTFTGQGSNLLDCDNRFRLFHKLPPLQNLSWRNVVTFTASNPYKTFEFRCIHIYGTYYRIYSIIYQHDRLTLKDVRSKFTAGNRGA